MIKQEQSLRVVIFGATSAIAQEVARLFAKAGAELFLIGRNKTKLEAVASDLKIRGAKRTEMITADLNDVSIHKKMIAEIVDSLGGIDVALLAHGILQGHVSDDNEGSPDYAAAEEVFRVNFLSYASLLFPLSDYLKNQGSGTIAVISSVAADRGRQSNFVYGSSKAALDSFASGLRNKLFKSGVHVMTIKPGFVSTPMTVGFKQGPLFVNPEVVGRLIFKALRKKADVIYVPCFWYLIMFIIRMIPERIFKRLKL